MTVIQLTTDEDMVRDYDHGSVGTDQSKPEVGMDVGVESEDEAEQQAEHSGEQTEPLLPFFPSLAAVNEAVEARGGIQDRGRGQSQRRAHGLRGSNICRASFSSDEALQDFRNSHHNPDDIELELIPLNANDQRLPGPNETIVPLQAICYAGLQFPMKTFFC